MQIIHKIDDFLYTIFPTVDKGDKQSLKAAIQEFYTYGPYKPAVIIEGDWIKIEIDTPTIISQESDYKKVIALCEKRKYDEAKPILFDLITQNPTNSEYYRIIGQILSDEGDQEEAINYLIDALRWDSKNGWALLMMGNIFAKFKNDIPTAMKYYDQALIAKPNDNITMNNIGANLMHQGKLAEAKKYFLEALKVNENYPNTHFALGMIAGLENDLQTAFNSTIQSIKVNKNRKDTLYQNSVKQAFEAAEKIIATDVGKKIYQKYKHKLEFEGDKLIEIIQDEDMPTAAKFEAAENYNKDTHTVRYKASYPAVEHLIMHELVHLDLVIQARKVNSNQLFVSTQHHKSEFLKGIKPIIVKLNKMGISEKSISDYCTSIFEGINRQVFNTPIDLFIENFLYHEFADLRPFQFISLYTLLQEGLKAVTDKKILEVSPNVIVSKSKTFNLVYAMQFKELFGFDFIRDFNGIPNELKLASAFYEEFLQYKDDKEPGEEYELVIHWAEDLKLDKFFELVDENEYRTKRTNIDNLLTSIEKDPFGLSTKDPERVRSMNKFIQRHSDSDANPAVVMYMVDALRFFNELEKDTIKKIAFEIAFIGTQGINPAHDNYTVSSIPGKTFSGYNLLAYYYVSWTLAVPELLHQLNLPFNKEYDIALQLFNFPQ